MTDLFADSLIPISAQIACVEREIALRRRVYLRWIDQERMTQEKADAEIAAMTAVLATLKDSRSLLASVAGKDVLLNAVSKLQGQRGVLIGLISDALRVLAHVDGDDHDEDEQLRAMRNRMSAVITEYAKSERNNEFGSP